MNHRLLRAFAAIAVVAVLGTLAACASGPANSIKLGWVGDLPPLDPAASASVSSFALLSQVYPSLLTVEAGDSVPVPDLAVSADWTADGVYTVVLKTGLKFANGDDLTTSDVQFSIERQLALQSEDGAWRQLGNISTVVPVTATTIEFHLKTATDASFPYVLAGPAGLILDEEQFFADELTSDADILTAKPFAGPFTLSGDRAGTLTLTPYDQYAGIGVAAFVIELHSGTSADLATQLHGGSIDALTGRMDADTITQLAADQAVLMTRAASGRTRLLAFDFEHMPFGTKDASPDEGKALAIRTAIADVIDRSALALSIGGSWVRPLGGYLPDGVPGVSTVVAGLYGDGKGGPAVETATQLLAAAGIATPLAFSIHVDLDAVGDPGSAEVAGIAAQLEATGLFTVNVITTDSAGLDKASAAGEVQAKFISVLPANSDPLGYLTPFRTGGPIATGYTDTDVDALLSSLSLELDPGRRAQGLTDVQALIAAKLPAIPIGQGVRVVFAGSSIQAVRLDDSLPLELNRLMR
ncbi:MAG: ABC transporter substrate-binding protein [Pseudolysinimonas sp.]|uniref:ABC transporter substrate-binding protein n=1 Tax=Pseudolysinimonas sp. TaxID=2680009 RepID=UPI00326339E7